jgi:hypothetical protein
MVVHHGIVQSGAGKSHVISHQQNPDSMITGHHGYLDTDRAGDVHVAITF